MLGVPQAWGKGQGESYTLFQTLPMFSIHAPRVGCDVVGGVMAHLAFGFNPRTPGGVRHGAKSVLLGDVVSIHAPRVGCDVVFRLASPKSRFQSTHPGWGATREK